MISNIQSPHPKHIRYDQTGFTLVEIMVGLTIGMLATVIILQVLNAFEAQKRATTGTADAQTNGNIALYNIARTIQQSGYPLSPATNSALECTALTINGVADASTPNRLTPVFIADGGVGGSDTITIRYGDSSSGGIFTTINGLGLGANERIVDNNLGCQLNDTTLIVTGTACSMSSVSAVSATNSITLADTTGALVDSKIACLGNWVEDVYNVTDGNLVLNGDPTVAGIVSLQAQYGISATPTSNTITEWVEPTAATGWNSFSTADRNLIKAIRFAVVARNSKMEPNNVTESVVTWTGSASSPAPALDLSADADWRRYRYRVFETIIPLRNVIWSKGTL